MALLHRITVAVLITAFCLLSISCESGGKDGEQKKEPVKEYLDSMNKTIKTARTISGKKSLIGVRDQLKYHIMQHGGKYPSKAEFTRLTRGKATVTYTGEGLTTAAGDKGVIAYIKEQTGKDQYDVLLANSRIVTISKTDLDKKLKISNSLRR